MICLFLSATPVAVAADDCRSFTTPDGYRTTKLTAGQYHFVEGIWLLHPRTPAGLPPGDGASLLTKAGSDDAVIVFTKKKLGCYMMPVTGKMIDYLRQIKDGPGEDL